MEDVEQRRQRLAAMREEAALQTEHDTLPSRPSVGAPFLPSDPLESSVGSERSVDTAAAAVKGSGFDFYTDPLAGFSGSKRRKPGSAVLRMPSNAPQSSNAPPHLQAGIVSHPPSHLQPAVIYPSLGPSSWQPIPYQPPPPSVPGFAFPQTAPQYYPQPAAQHMNQFPNQSYERGRDSGRGGRDGGRGYPGGHVGGRGFGTGGTGYLPNGPGGGGGGRGYVTPNGRGGRGNSWSGRSPAGNSWGDGNRSAGRGQRGGRTISAREQPHLFFRKSMVEDPWERLEASRVERT